MKTNLPKFFFMLDLTSL